MHWNAGEAAGRAAQLQAAGFKVEVFAPDSGASLRRFRESPAAAFIIDLTRLPSHGRAIATALRQQKATRLVPIVFAGGDPEKVERTRSLLPDAAFARWDDIPAALARALKNPPREAVVPDTMAGYSGTPLAKKLGIRAGAAVALLGAPAGFEAKLGPLPDGVRVRRDTRSKSKIILLFVKSQAELERRFAAAGSALEPRGALWVVWPKRSSGIACDVTQAGVRAFGMASSFVDYKVCAVDETWSGLCFARRA